MRGVNKVILVGNLGQDPDVKTLPSGSSVANCSLATSTSWTDSSGEKREKVEWHRLVMFNRLAEIAGQYLRKGAPIYVEGNLQTRKWEKEGVPMYTTEINVREMQMLGRRDDGGGDMQGSNYQSGAPQQQQRPQQSQQQQQGSSSTPANNSPQQPEYQDFDDDIPF